MCSNKAEADSGIVWSVLVFGEPLAAKTPSADATRDKILVFGYQTASLGVKTTLTNNTSVFIHKAADCVTI